jgi:ATP-binding cassette subfamily B protein
MGSEESNRKMYNITEKLGLRQEIDKLPMEYDTPLGRLTPESVDMSGGQWQRIAMARSLMSDAPVQILDEPTAALDPISESRLYEQFGEISQGKTTIFISHRLGSTKLADHIFVLKGGRILEEGSHDQLIGQHGLYAQMYESQRSWYQD